LAAQQTRQESLATHNQPSDIDDMESIGPPPPTGDGMLFVLNSSQREEAMRRHIAGATSNRLHAVKSATSGQPIFLFDSDTREMHGPYAAEGPGAMNLDSQSTGTSNFTPRLPAQIRFAPVVRAFAPLPEAAIEDVINFDSGADAQGRLRPSFTVEGYVVAQLLYIFVLRHHGLYESDDADASAAEPLDSSSHSQHHRRDHEHHATRHNFQRGEGRSARADAGGGKGGGRTAVGASKGNGVGKGVGGGSRLGIRRAN
jgi:hypothetical protein